tara:strand:- start:2479 stop:3195 length:717 start_codon:yes stop_codon:yes gene_type:complete
MKNYGLIGKSLEHSFSETYFNKKFKKLNLKAYNYNNYEIKNVLAVKELINKNNLIGLNVTIPFKIEIIKILDKLDKNAEITNSVNTIKIEKNKLIGYNTDIIGFEKSIIPIIDKRKNALILGNGGASKSIQHVLKKLNINFTVISRKDNKNYSNLKKEDIISHEIIINTTPLGMYPKIDLSPNILYEFINNKHLAYDLIYNPSETVFLKKAKNNGSKIKNGYEMLKIQADESWKIWNK